MIISILDTAFATAAAAVDAVEFEYQSGVPSELNCVDSADKSKVYWHLPFQVEDSRIKSGQKISKIVATLTFLTKSLLSDTQPSRTPQVDLMHTAMNQFYDALEANSSLSPTVVTNRYEDVYNEFDANMDGVHSIAVIEFPNSLC